jgi:hypothetical protein
MPSSGNAAANTAAPQPPNVSQNVPKNSAAIRRMMSFFTNPPPEKWLGDVHNKSLTHGRRLFASRV